MNSSWFYRNLIRPALFTRDSEEIHDLTVRWLAWASRHPSLLDGLEAVCGSALIPSRVLGLHFPNPVGLAAGMDKAAAAVPVWKALGFGFAELGGVTGEPQPGNPRPRMFRAVSDGALVNRMGFNNPGAAVVEQTLAAWRMSGCWPKHPVGINLGKSKVTPLPRAAEEYAASFRLLLPHADFFVVNVSSPNTPQLRQLQDKTALDEILAALQEVNASHSRPCPASFAASTAPAASARSVPKPVLVKVAPDLSFQALDEILSLTGPRQVAGLVAVNTTLARPETPDQELRRVYAEPGGLSGCPLRLRAIEVVRHLYRQTAGTLPIIGVGGISTPDHAWEMISHGASLVQIYTGLVYEGPTLPRRIVAGLHQRLAREGFTNLTQAIGCQVRSDNS